MKIVTGLKNVICHFDGGFATARLNSDGDRWDYVAHSITFNERFDMALVKGENHATPEFVGEYGHEEGFTRAINRLPIPKATHD